MRPLKFLIPLFIFIGADVFAQNCDCNREFLHIKKFMENNYAGFKDKLATITKPRYDKLIAFYSKYTNGKYAMEKCLLIITQYLNIFKDQHIQVQPNFDVTKTDSGFISQREIINIPDEKIAELQRSKGPEGIYIFRFDSAYKIAVLKTNDPLRDYIGVVVSSKLPGWKKGMLKFEAKKVNDKLYRGVLYMRNHLPKVEGFDFDKNRIAGDWLREGSVWEDIKWPRYVPVGSKKLSDKTFYIKISNFSSANAKNIDSLFSANKEILGTMPNLVLDLRDNGGGADFAFGPILPYIYTNPLKNTGVDVLSTDANIAGWKKTLGDEDIPEDNKRGISRMITVMENNKGRLVNIVDDETDSSYQPLPFPRKVVILINKGCASTTEQFLLFARQSSKVILAGENTQGTLDYSNMREASFECLPYLLNYATTRSRRLDIHQGIDNVGIKPKYYFKTDTDWIEAAMKLAEQ